jgi:hypothetical protein
MTPISPESPTINIQFNARSRESMQGKCIPFAQAIRTIPSPATPLSLQSAEGSPKAYIPLPGEGLLDGNLLRHYFIIG